MKEAHVEQLLGRTVHDVNGDRVGRLHEMRVEIIDGLPRVTEFHVGPAASLQRIALFVKQIPPFGWLPVHRWEYRIRWELFDLADPDAPKVRVPKDELERYFSFL